MTSRSKKQTQEKALSNDKPSTERDIDEVSVTSKSSKAKQMASSFSLVQATKPEKRKIRSKKLFMNNLTNQVRSAIKQKNQKFIDEVVNKNSETTKMVCFTKRTTVVLSRSLVIMFRRVAESIFSFHNYNMRIYDSAHLSKRKRTIDPHYLEACIRHDFPFINFSGADDFVKEMVEKSNDASNTKKRRDTYSGLFVKFSFVKKLLNCFGNYSLRVKVSTVTRCAYYFDQILRCLVGDLFEDCVNENRINIQLFSRFVSRNENWSSCFEKNKIFVLGRHVKRETVSKHILVDGESKRVLKTREKFICQNHPFESVVRTVMERSRGEDSRLNCSKEAMKLIQLICEDLFVQKLKEYGDPSLKMLYRTTLFINSMIQFSNAHLQIRDEDDVYSRDLAKLLAEGEESPFAKIKHSFVLRMIRKADIKKSHSTFKTCVFDRFIRFVYYFVIGVCSYTTHLGLKTIRPEIIHLYCRNNLDINFVYDC